MKLIINVPDDQFDRALAVAQEERQDYAKRYDRPGWGWTFYKDGARFWVRGIKGGISVSQSSISVPAKAGTTERQPAPRDALKSFQGHPTMSQMRDDEVRGVGQDCQFSKSQPRADGGPIPAVTKAESSATSVLTALADALDDYAPADAALCRNMARAALAEGNQ